MLELLARHHGRLVSQAMLLREVWGLTYTNETHYLSPLHGAAPTQARAGALTPRHLLTEPGMGYRLPVE